MVAASKMPMLKPGEYELWRMRMEQYIQMIDYSLWEVIKNGNAPLITKVVEGVETTIALITTKEKAQRRLELKARSTLLMGIPNEHQLKFTPSKMPSHYCRLLEKFGGKQHQKNSEKIFRGSSIKSLTASSLRGVTQTFDRLQKPYHEMEIHEEDDLSGRWLSNRVSEFLEEQLEESFSVNVLRKTIGFDKSKVECYNCHKMGHFAKEECRAPRNQENKNRENTRRVMPVETTTSNAWCLNDVLIILA
ncbi:ribonuclease H-like domain-containing protein [Tanacetum coccineum]